MSGIYLNGTQAGYPSLLEVVRRAVPDATGWDGWEWRARGSGGFPSPGPMGFVVHHTASPARSTPGQQFSGDASYCAVGHPDSPVGNMVLGPEGQVSVHAAGAANTQGQGGPWTTSRGVVPQDGGNSRLVACEASNDGQGQSWSPAQCQAYEAIAVELAGAYGFRLDRWGDHASDVLSHEEWCRPSCPGRKCDPAGPSPWSPQPTGGCSAGNLWSMDAFRTAAATGGPLPGDDVTDEDIQRIAAAVWNVMLHNYVANAGQEAQFILGFAHSEAFNGSWQRGIQNMVNGEVQPAADLLRYTHGEAFAANEKAARILALLEPDGG